MCLGPLLVLGVGEAGGAADGQSRHGTFRTENKPYTCDDVTVQLSKSLDFIYFICRRGGSIAHVPEKPGPCESRTSGTHFPRPLGMLSKCSLPAAPSPSTNCWANPDGTPHTLPPAHTSVPAMTCPRVTQEENLPGWGLPLPLLDPPL